MPPVPFDPPLPWLWSCHHCHTRYPLGATRRCLHDGHYFCGGTTVSLLTGRPIKRHKACGSEFDYVGWEDMAEWRAASQRAAATAARTYATTMTTTATAEGRKRKSCETSCKFPSDCHYTQRKVPRRRASSAPPKPTTTPHTISLQNTDNRENNVLPTGGLSKERKPSKRPRSPKAKAKSTAKYTDTRSSTVTHTQTPSSNKALHPKIPPPMIHMFEMPDVDIDIDMTDNIPELSVSVSVSPKSSDNGFG